MKNEFVKRITFFTLVFVILTSVNGFAAEILYQNDFRSHGDSLKRLSGSYQTGHHRISNLGGRNIMELRTGIAANNTRRQYGVLFGEENWQSYTMSIAMKGHQYLTHSMGVIFNYRGGQNYYSLTWTNGKVGNLHVQMGTPRLCLTRGGIYDMGVILEEAAFPEGVDPLLWHHYRIETKNNTIYVYLDDIKEPIFKYKDTDFIDGGKAGLAVYSNYFVSSPGYFGNLVIYK